MRGKIGGSFDFLPGVLKILGKFFGGGAEGGGGGHPVAFGVVNLGD